MKQIAVAIIEVMKEVKGMEKNSRVGSGNYGYNGTKDQDVKEVFNEALSKHGLSIMPIDIDESTQIDRWPEGNKQKQSVFTKVKVKYMLLHTSGESITIAGYGHGVDAQDKAAGKATTYAMKNALLYTFLTPVGKIDDTETTHSEEIATPQTIQGTPKLKTFTDKAFKAILSSDKVKVEQYLDKKYLSGVGYELNNTQVAELTTRLAVLKAEEIANKK